MTAIVRPHLPVPEILIDLFLGPEEGMMGNPPLLQSVPCLPSERTDCNESLLLNTPMEECD